MRIRTPYLRSGGAQHHHSHPL